VATVFPIPNVAIIRPVKITNVLILVNYLVDRERIVKSIIMWLFVDALEDSLEILSKVVDDLLKMRFARLVVPTLTVKWVRMIGQSVVAKKITSETHCKDVAGNAKPIVIVAHPNNVHNSSV